MKNRIFGIKLSTILLAVACLLLAVLIWMFVKYDLYADNAGALLKLLSFMRN